MRSATFFLQIQDMHGWTSHALREWKKQDYSMIVGMVINKMWSITITGVIILPSQTMHYDFRGKTLKIYHTMALIDPNHMCSLMTLYKV